MTKAMEGCHHPLACQHRLIDRVSLPPAERAVTAAYFLNPTLHLATVVQGENSALGLIDARCASFHLSSRDSEATCELSANVVQFLNTFEITSIVLRSGATRGPYAPHAFAFKVEAILDMALAPNLRQLQSAQVARWSDRYNTSLPSPQDLGFDRVWREGQFKAIQAGAYSLMHE